MKRAFTLGDQPPMMTVGQPGPGMIGVPCMLESPILAAGKPPIVTVRLPWAIPLGAGERHTMPPGALFATAAGAPPISTVGTAAAGVIGPPPCGLGPSESGQSAVSPTRSAGPVGIYRPTVPGTVRITREMLLSRHGPGKSRTGQLRT